MGIEGFKFTVAQGPGGNQEKHNKEPLPESGTPESFSGWSSEEVQNFRALILSQVPFLSMQSIQESPARDIFGKLSSAEWNTLRASSQRNSEIPTRRRAAELLTKKYEAWFDEQDFA